MINMENWPENWPYLWNYLLIALSIINFTYLLLREHQPLHSHQQKINKTKKRKTFKESIITRLLWSWRWYLALIYVIACGVRGWWPRIDGERICMYDSGLITTVFVGRTLATFAEISFACVVMMCVAKAIQKPWAHTVCTTFVLLNIVAQSCCWYSIVTQNQLGHVVEESLWALSAGAVFWCCLVGVMREKKSPLSPSPDTHKFLHGALITTPLYILFMVTVDIPMYYLRWRGDEEAGRVYKGWEEGMGELVVCAGGVVAEGGVWGEEVMWMTGYFSVGVLGCIWLATCRIY